MELSLITGDLEFASAAESVGVDRVMLDLERKSKIARQAGRDLFLSDHRIDLVPRMRSVLRKAALVVRINSLDHQSREEIDAVVQGGAHLIMLPFFYTASEVRQFVDLVGGRAQTILLIETKSAVDNLREIVRVEGIGEIHVGLNDLTISLGRRVIFDVICDGMMDQIVEIIRAEGIPFGFGGIGRLSRQDLPVNPERVLAVQVGAGATRGWLGRSFRSGMEVRKDIGELAHELVLLRQSILRWRLASQAEHDQNCELLRKEVSAWGGNMLPQVLPGHANESTKNSANGASSATMLDRRNGDIHSAHRSVKETR